MSRIPCFNCSKSFVSKQAMEAHFFRAQSSCFDGSFPLSLTEYCIQNNRAHCIGCNRLHKNNTGCPTCGNINRSSPHSNITPQLQLNQLSDLDAFGQPSSSPDTPPTVSADTSPSVSQDEPPSYDPSLSADNSVQPLLALSAAMLAPVSCVPAIPLKSIRKATDAYIRLINSVLALLLPSKIMSNLCSSLNSFWPRNEIQKLIKLIRFVPELTR